jgi:diguanylate cyclase (GGDEF)-like protein
MRVTNNTILHEVPSHKTVYVALVAAALLVIALVDHATGDIPFQHLYYLPIIVAATQFEFIGGLTVSVASVVLYHLANFTSISRYRLSEADVVQSLLFLIVGMVAAKLAHDAKRLRLLSITDDLTGLHNLRSFESHLANFVSDAKKDGSILSVLVIDVDHLKSLNDRYGHLAGADAVRTVGKLIAQHMPANSVACRYGGDEFVVAIPNCGNKEAKKIAEHLCQSVSEAQPVLATAPFPEGTLSISVGTASRQITRESDLLEAGEELFRSADQALYRAKDLGRNGVSTAATH